MGAVSSEHVEGATMIIRSAYSPRVREQVDATGPTRTKLSMQDEVDVNRIVDRFRKTGLISHLAKGQPQYLDVSGMRDYREALDEVRAVDVFFRGLPATMRARFDNDAATFLDFVTDPANEAVVRSELGGITPPVAAPAPPVEPEL